MLALISFLLVCIGSLNWFSIGILQYDFVAGIFGSQSNIFSRIIYALVGVASIIVAFNLIKNKGKFIISFKKENEEFDEFMQDEKSSNRRKSLASTESSEDFDFGNKESNCNCREDSCHCDKDDEDKHKK